MTAKKPRPPKPPNVVVKIFSRDLLIHTHYPSNYVFRKALDRGQILFLRQERKDLDRTFPKDAPHTIYAYRNPRMVK